MTPTPEEPPEEGPEKDYSGSSPDGGDAALRGWIDPDDRRRLTLELTDRGRAAAEVGWKATDRVDRELEAKVGAEAIRQMRATVGALVSLREE